VRGWSASPKPHTRLSKGSSLSDPCSGHFRACSDGISYLQTLQEVNGLDLRNEVLDSKSWVRFIEHVKASPRPLVITVIHRLPSEVPQPLDPQEVMAKLQVRAGICVT
jgi:hypothetical protein